MSDYLNEQDHIEDREWHRQQQRDVDRRAQLIERSIGTLTGAANALAIHGLTRDEILAYVDDALREGTN
jgi:hypothetical protein